MSESKQEKITLTKVIELMGEAFTEYQKAYRPDSDVSGPLYPRNKYSNIIAYMASKIWPFIATKDKEIAAALDLIVQYGGIDGGHHKQWVLDQVVRALTGDKYEEWLKNYENGEDGPKTYSWDIGIAP